jgi:hypothetical protein
MVIVESPAMLFSWDLHTLSLPNSMDAFLVRKGLAVPASDLRKDRFSVTRRDFRCTIEGYWLGDSLRILNRQGELPEGRTR